MRDMIKKIKTFFNKIHVKFMSNSSYIRYLRAKGVHIGTGCNIHKGVVFGTEPWLIKIGNNVRITKGVQFITHDGGLWTLRKMGLIDKEAVKYGTIMIGDNCNISWNVIIMPDVMIGNNCIIAAGAVVTKNIPDLLSLLFFLKVLGSCRNKEYSGWNNMGRNSSETNRNCRRVS